MVKQTKRIGSRPTKRSTQKTGLLTRLLSFRQLIIIAVLMIIGTVLLVAGHAATPAPSPNNNASQRFPGDPNPRVSGKRYWGSAVSGNGDPVAAYESVTGKSLSVRRTYWGWSNNRTSMISTIKDDLAHNRLPYVSTKTPDSTTAWADIAAGKYDADLDAMLKAVDATGGPVWLTVFHEPEDDTRNPAKPEKCDTDPSHAPCSGTAADWRAMQKHIRDRMKALGTKHIAFMPTLMSWTWDSRSGRVPADYWVDGIWDVLGTDHYNETASTNIYDATAWKNYVAFAQSKNIPMAIGEWGIRGIDTTAGQKVRDFWNWSFNNNNDLLAYAYFDSGLNSPSGSWALQGEQLNTFKDILKNDPRVQRIADLGTGTSTSTGSTGGTSSGGTPTTTTDTTPPAIVSTAPASNSIVSGVVAVKITSSDSSGIASTNYGLNDGSGTWVWQFTDTANPSTWSWDTTKVANGTYGIRARVRDNAGNITDKIINVSVNNTVPSNTLVKTTNLSAAFTGWNWSTGSLLTLSWSNSNGALATGFNISRNSQFIGSTKTTSFTDQTALKQGQVYTYEVTATGNNNTTSAPAQIKVSVDTCTTFIWTWCTAKILQ